MSSGVQIVFMICLTLIALCIIATKYDSNKKNKK